MRVAEERLEIIKQRLDRLTRLHDGPALRLDLPAREAGVRTG